MCNDTLHIFNKRVQKLKDMYGIVGELKWTKIKNSAGQANLRIELLGMVRPLIMTDAAADIPVLTEYEFALRERCFWRALSPGAR